MRKLLLLSTFFTLALVGCKKDSTKTTGTIGSIVGKWNLNTTYNTTYVNGVISASLSDTVNNINGVQYYQFNADKTCIINTGTIYNETYNVSGNNLIINFFSPSTYQIRQLTSDALTLHYENQGPSNLGTVKVVWDGFFTK